MNEYNHEMELKARRFIQDGIDNSTPIFSMIFSAAEFISNNPEFHIETANVLYESLLSHDLIEEHDDPEGLNSESSESNWDNEGGRPKNSSPEGQYQVD